MREVFCRTGGFERDAAGAEVGVGGDDLGFGGVRVVEIVAEIGVGGGPIHVDGVLAVERVEALRAGMVVAAWRCLVSCYILERERQRILKCNQVCWVMNDVA